MAKCKRANPRIKTQAQATPLLAPSEHLRPPRSLPLPLLRYLPRDWQFLAMLIPWDIQLVHVSGCFVCESFNMRRAT